jgi:hypothetical protein
MITPQCLSNCTARAEFRSRAMRPQEPRPVLVERPLFSRNSDIILERKKLELETEINGS